MKIAVIADIHWGDPSQAVKRRCEIADILLTRAVYRVNRLIKPDVTVVLGDVVDDGASPAAEERLRQMRAILDKLNAPYIAIPGNHDGDVDQFYRAFDRPKDIVDIAGVRFLPFVDKEEPRCRASRIEADMNRMRTARVDYDGPLVSLQHVCLCPPVDQPVAPYNYTNAADVIKVMQEVGLTLSVSGHHHHGAEDTTDGCVTFVNAPGLCESPFQLLEITMEGKRISTERHELVAPKGLRLFDNHLHTQLAYCSENMTIERAVSLAHEFGLAGVTFTEHSGHLYFDRKPYWRNEWMESGIEGADPVFNRMPRYVELKRTYEDDFARFSLEVDCDARGQLLLKPDDVQTFSPLMGTVHCLPGLTKDSPPQKRDLDEFLFLVDGMGKAGVSVLAHPMRVFRRMGWETPTELFEPTAKLLRQYGMAAEINFHSNEPRQEFIKACLDSGVKFSFGSDAHNLAEIGDFAYHIELVRNAGYDGDLDDILIAR